MTNSAKPRIPTDDELRRAVPVKDGELEVDDDATVIRFNPESTEPRIPTNDELRDAVSRVASNSEGDISVDGDAIVSHGEDPGAYVAAWVWVPFRCVPGYQHEDYDSDCEG